MWPCGVASIDKHTSSTQDCMGAIGPNRNHGCENYARDKLSTHLQACYGLLRWSICFPARLAPLCEKTLYLNACFEAAEMLLKYRTSSCLIDVRFSNNLLARRIACNQSISHKYSPVSNMIQYEQWNLEDQWSCPMSEEFFETKKDWRVQPV